MEYIQKNEESIEVLPGRGLIRAVGKNSALESQNMTVGYALYNESFGEMEPHCHAEETVIITKSENGYVSWGNDKNDLTHTLKLETGMILHIPEGEWHRFHYEEKGNVDIIFIYGSTENCRPEDK